MHKQQQEETNTSTGSEHYLYKALLLNKYSKVLELSARADISNPNSAVRVNGVNLKQVAPGVTPTFQKSDGLYEFAELIIKGVPIFRGDLLQFMDDTFTCITGNYCGICARPQAGEEILVAVSGVGEVRVPLRSAYPATMAKAALKNPKVTPKCDDEFAAMGEAFARVDTFLGRLIWKK